MAQTRPEMVQKRSKKGPKKVQKRYKNNPKIYPKITQKRPIYGQKRFMHLSKIGLETDKNL